MPFNALLTRSSKMILQLYAINLKLGLGVRD